MENSVILSRFLVHQLNHQTRYAFLTNFELLLENTANQNRFISIIIGGFNARSKKWCSAEKTTYEGKKSEFLTSQRGFKQVSNDATQILENSFLCII